MKIIWFEEAWADYLYWQTQDKKTVKRIRQLLQDATRNGYAGIGKPEPLQGEFGGFWGRRIDEINRFVYRARGGMLEVLSCKGHYDI